MAEEEFNTVEEIQNILIRKPIPRGQISLLKALYEAGPAGLPKEKLAELTRNGDLKSLIGVIGALGKRVNHSWGV